MEKTDKTFVITRVCADDEGVSYFEDERIALEDKGALGFMSALHAAPGVIFRQVEADYASGWHTPPSPLYLVVLDGEIEIETGRHEIRAFGPGSVILAMDLAGRGHFTRATGARPVRSLVVPSVQRDLEVAKRKGI